MKIPLQEKIAELEQRIERLEKMRSAKVTVKTEEVFGPMIKTVEFFGDSWREMWQHFNDVMKKAFG